MPGRLAEAQLFTFDWPQGPFVRVNFASPVVDPAIVLTYPRGPRPGHQWTISSVTADVTLPFTASANAVAIAQLILGFGPEQAVIGTYVADGSQHPSGAAPLQTLVYSSSFTMDWSDTIRLWVRLQLTSGGAGDVVEFVDTLPVNTVNVRLSGTVS